MNNYQIIKHLANNCPQVWHPLRRYFIILNNHLRNKPISLVEKRNHIQNPPRLYYIERFAKEFNLAIDINSPLFERRLNKELNQIQAYSFAIPRFFRRLDEARAAKLEMSPQVITDLMMMGDVLFKTEYPTLIPLDP